MDLKELTENMRSRFLAGELRDYRERVRLLKRLKAEVESRTDEILAALKADFNKNEFDGYTTEVGIVLQEINHFIKKLKGYTKPKRVKTSLITFPSKGYVYSEGYGVALIIAPWNYPFQLALAPLVGAIAAGNFVVLKPASRTRHTSDVIERIVSAVFDGGQAIVERGARDKVNVLDVKFDYIFFTGGEESGRRVMEAAAKTLTPLSLELGGKSPCIVDESAQIEISACRLAWGKFLNGGQTCVAPDYLLLHDKIREPFLAALKSSIRAMYYDGDNLSEELAYLSDEEKGEEMAALVKESRVIEGGTIDGRKMQPTLIEADFSHPSMQKEIFAPLLPVIGFNSTEEIIREINSRPRPLALYYFGARPQPFIEGCPFGGGCVNDTVMHVAEGELPFGGVGASGMGRYHGKASFDTFTHYKSVLKKGAMDIKTRYAPHSDKALAFVKKLMK